MLLRQSQQANGGFETAMDPVVLRLRLIGPMEARSVANKNVLPAGRKTRALLACIAMTAPRPVLRSSVVKLLWSRSPEQQARASLRQEIHRLLDALSPIKKDLLIVTRDQLTLQPEAVWTDVMDVIQADAKMPAALSLLEADLLEDLDGVDSNFDLWLQTNRRQLRNRGLRIAESMLQDVLSVNDAIEAAERILTIDRSHEGAWRTLMRVHAARGERGLAIQAYNRCRSALAATLDAAPSMETRELLSEIQQSSNSQISPNPSQHSEGSASSAVPALLLREQDELPPRKREMAAACGTCIGVMPFRLIGLPNEHVHLSRGLADEITNALSRFRLMRIISSDSFECYITAGCDEAAIRRQYGLDFLLDGLVQRTGSKIRISAQLLDLRANNQVVWARRFDREMDDLLSLQDEIAAEVAAQVEPEVLGIESERSARRGLVNATAYDLMLQAIPLIGRLENEPFMQAGQHLADAITLEPDYAPPYAWYAYWHIFLIGQGWSDRPKAMMEKAGKLAERAIVLDPFDARGFSINGHVQAFLHRRLREAMVLHERALSLNPNLAIAWALSAMTHAYAGDPDEAGRRIQRYKKLSPLDPHAFIFDGFTAVIDLMKGDYEQAVEVGRRISLLNPTLLANYKPYLAALGHLRRDKEAAIVRQQLLALEPNFTIERFLEQTPMEHQSDKMHYVKGLRLAGIQK